MGMNKFNSNMIEVIMNQMVEKSKDAPTYTPYESGKNFIDNIFRFSSSEMDRLHYAYDNGFYQGKYAMRTQMLLMFEDVLNTVLQLIEEGDDHGKET